jgi:hypothetical protein
LWGSFCEECVEIEMFGGHGELAFGVARPCGGIAIDVEFEAVVIGIAEVEGFADAVVGGAVERDFVFDEAAQGICEGGAIRVKNGDVVEARGAAWWGFAAASFPGVEADVMMVTTRRDEGGLGAVALGELETEDAAVEGEGALQVGHFEVDVADADGGVDGRAHEVDGG